jgi:predicted patatin/cPLA2 family phospholipase
MTSLLLEGGGMRAGFVAGALMALTDLGITRFDQALAVSASVPTLAYFAAGQREELETVWREELNTPKLVCYRNIPATSIHPSVTHPILDIDYLVYEVFERKYPLDLDRLLESGVDCRFAATCVNSRKLVLLDPQAADIYQIFKAALAVPGCYPAAVRVNGLEYADGGAVDPLPVRRFSEIGASRFLAVLSRPLQATCEPPGLLERVLLWRYFSRHDWILNTLLDSAKRYNEQTARLAFMSHGSDPKAMVLCPERLPPAGFITRDRRKINRTIDQGYRSTMKQAEAIQRFVSGPRASGN